jgi:hypothetical protein
MGPIGQWLLILLVVWFGVFLMTRWFWLWYFRINEIVRLLQIIAGENPNRREINEALAPTSLQTDSPPP